MSRKLKRFLRSFSRVGQNFCQLSVKEKIQICLFLAIIVLLIWGVPKLFTSPPKALYEVAVFAHNQSNSDSGSSMGIGDVLVTMKEGHSWSNTEKISYLILKMNLTEEQARKLTQADEKEIPFKDWSEEEKKRAEEEEARAEEEDREYMREPKRETLRPRLYQIDMENKVFAGFKRTDLLNGQPFDDQVFDWSIVDKKRKLNNDCLSALGGGDGGEEGEIMFNIQYSIFIQYAIADKYSITNNQYSINI